MSGATTAFPETVDKLKISISAMLDYGIRNSISESHFDGTNIIDFLSRFASSRASLPLASSSRWLSHQSMVLPNVSSPIFSPRNHFRSIS